MGSLFGGSKKTDSSTQLSQMQAEARKQQRRLELERARAEAETKKSERDRRRQLSQIQKAQLGNLSLITSGSPLGITDTLG